MATRTIIFNSRLKEGIEQQLIQDLKTIFPSDALRGIDGLDKVTICQGHGMFSAVIEYDGDFEKIYYSYISNPSVQAFHSRMANYLEDIPTSTKPADLPLVGDVLHWEGKRVQEAVG
jgi:hypothetical protein